MKCRSKLTNENMEIIEKMRKESQRDLNVAIMSVLTIVMFAASIIFIMEFVL
jgi:hypothetical protein